MCGRGSSRESSVEAANLAWQWPEEGVQGKPATYGEREQAVCNLETWGHAEEAHVAGSKGTELPEEQSQLGWVANSGSIWGPATCGTGGRGWAAVGGHY